MRLVEYAEPGSAIQENLTLAKRFPTPNGKGVTQSTRPSVLRCLHLCWLLAALQGSSCWLYSADQDGDRSTKRYEFRRDHDSDGIGKFYLGREIAQVMSSPGADWLERPEREGEEHAAVLVEQLRLRPRDNVADIGAGTGYFSRRLAREVGPFGKVFAVDVQPEMLRLLTNSSTKLGLTNIVPVLGTEIDPRLPTASVDLALLVDVYHEFAFPYEMMQAICRAVRSDGRVVLVEYRGEDDGVPIKRLHKMTEAQVKREMSELPLEWIQTIEVLPRQHILVFRRLSPKGDALPRRSEGRD